MKISFDDYEAIMESSRIIVDLIGSKGVLTDPIDVAAMLYEWKNRIQANDEVGYESSGGVTMLYLPECEDDDCDDCDPGGFEIMINVSMIGDDGVSYIFDESTDLQYMDSVPIEARELTDEEVD